MIHTVPYFKYSVSILFLTIFYTVKIIIFILFFFLWPLFGWFNFQALQMKLLYRIWYRKFSCYFFTYGLYIWINLFVSFSLKHLFEKYQIRHYILLLLYKMLIIIFCRLFWRLRHFSYCFGCLTTFLTVLKSYYSLFLLRPIFLSYFQEIKRKTIYIICHKDKNSDKGKR